MSFLLVLQNDIHWQSAILPVWIFIPSQVFYHGSSAELRASEVEPNCLQQTFSLKQKACWHQTLLF